MEGLSEGRIVHFVLDSRTDGNEIGEVICRPAIIVNAWGGKLEDGMVNLQVFMDGANDTRYLKGFENFQSLTIWGTSIKYSETKEAGTWHWPERV